MTGFEEPMACGVCHLVLNRYLAVDTGKVSYLHPMSPTSATPPHAPEPVPADQIDSRQVCDFCSDPKIVYTFQLRRPVDTFVIGDDFQLLQQYGSDWAACFECAQLVQHRDLDGVFSRCVRSGESPLDDAASQSLRLTQQAVLDQLHPGKTIAGIGTWPPTTLDPSTLPKVRDRLTRLVRGDDRLPLGLNPPDAREQLAAGLDAARLFWIDPEFTNLVGHAAASLPSTNLTPEDVPAPHGLVAWAEPVGDRDVIVAASWTCTSEGIRAVCYRSVGTGLAGTTMQELREQVGWLIPIHASLLQPTDTVDAHSPFSAVVVTWLLIAQKLAETASADVHRSIRKSYQRHGRPAPEVSLVRIRGTQTSEDLSRADRTRRADEPSPDRQHRWWVRGFWRNQPYGPGRALRRALFIQPHLRGPQDKPIRSSTIVRVLGNTQPPQEGNEEA